MIADFPSCIHLFFYLVKICIESFFFKELRYNRSFHTKSKYTCLLVEVEALKIVPITVYRLKIGQTECYIEAVICFPQPHKHVSKEAPCFNFIVGKIKQISKDWKKSVNLFTMFLKLQVGTTFNKYTNI